jgi:hypothetical protein
LQAGRRQVKLTAMEAEPQASVPARKLQLFGLTKHGSIAVVTIALLAIMVPVVLQVTMERGSRDRYRKARVKHEMLNLLSAISTYRIDYGQHPYSKGDELAGEANQGSLTYGWVAGTSAEGVSASNADLMAILLALENFPDGRPALANQNGNRNPRKIPFLYAKMASDNHSPGIGKDGNYRDPWGNPYVVTLDLDYDGYCVDPVYSQPAVGPSSDQHLRHIKVRTNKLGMLELPYPALIWSLGPDGKADPTIPADQGVNRDNILSWQ